MDAAKAMRHGLGLLELDERATEILGMQEQHGLAVGADLGIALAEDARSLRQRAGRAPL